MNTYIHGFSPRESQRLNEQSGILEELLHGDVNYLPGSRVLEAGCGVGAQTLILARRSPEAEFVSVDQSKDSLDQAETSVKSAGITNVEFRRRDIFDLQFPAESFDHVFVCFVLEHVADPDKALLNLKHVLKPGGTITVIEGDHQSCIWHPHTPSAQKAWDAMIKVQQDLGHDPLIGRRLYPLIASTGFNNIEVAPKPAYVDMGNPEAKSDALFKILVPMAQTAKQRALELDLISEETWDKGISEFSRVGTDEEGALFYTWFKGTALK